MVSPETRLPRRPDHSEASVTGIGADSIRHGGSGTGSGRHVADTGASYEQPSSEVETVGHVTLTSLSIIH